MRIGVLGYGRIGAEHCGWIARAGLQVSAVLDPTPARRDLARSRGLPVVANLADLHAACDAVLVATPSALHADDALAAIAAGRHVMIEKPLALRLAPALAVADAARNRGVTACVFHCRRWDSDFLRVRGLLASGIVGRVFNVESRLGQWASCVGPAAPEWNPQWRTQAAWGGGALYDWGSHFLDQLHVLLAPSRPLRVHAQLRPTLWSRDCDDLARVHIEFSGGELALMEINTSTTHPLPRWHLDGTFGSASSPPSPTFDTSIWARLNIRPTTPPGHSPTPDFSTPPQLTEPDIWKSFATAARTGTQPPIPIDSALDTMRLLEAALISAEYQSVVPFADLP
jgi:scyllo-inositol 2-dehydrogenase (NADP+)